MFFLLAITTLFSYADDEVSEDTQKCHSTEYFLYEPFFTLQYIIHHTDMRKGTLIPSETGNHWNIIDT